MSVQTASSQNTQPVTSDGEVHSIREANVALLRELYKSKNKAMNKIFGKLEKNTGIKRENLVYAALGILSLYLIVGQSASLVCNLIGFAYPVYASVKAIRTERKDDDTMWLTYWSVFAAFNLVDFWAKQIMLPIYWLIKTIFLFYLSMPQTRGAIKIYVNVVDPTVTKLDLYFGQKE